MIGDSIFGLRLPVPSDLCAAAVEDAIEMLRAAGQKASTLVAHSSYGSDAYDLGIHYGLQCVILSSMSELAWVVIGESTWVWSP